MQVGSDNVVLSALYPENGNVLARLYAYRGRPGEAQVTLFGAAAELTEVNLMGEFRNAVSSPLRLSPRQIRTVRLDDIAGVRSHEHP